jgi:hypothetical protein
MKKRKLISLWRPADFGKEWFICYAYYDENGNWTGESEEAQVSDEKLYELLKPVLVKKVKKDEFNYGQRNSKNQR